MHSVKRDSIAQRGSPRGCGTVALGGIAADSRDLLMPEWLLQLGTLTSRPREIMGFLQNLSSGRREGEHSILSKLARHGVALAQLAKPMCQLPPPAHWSCSQKPAEPWSWASKWRLGWKDSSRYRTSLALGKPLLSLLLSLISQFRLEHDHHFQKTALISLGYYNSSLNDRAKS